MVRISARKTDALSCSPASVRLWGLPKIILNCHEESGQDVVLIIHLSLMSWLGKRGAVPSYIVILRFLIKQRGRLSVPLNR